MFSKTSIFNGSGSDKAAGSGVRRLARELALRLLFQQDSGDSVQPEETVRLFSQSFDPEKDDEQALGMSQKNFSQAWPFARTLFFGVCQHLTAIDEVLAKAANNWQISRMSLVDRNLLRLAYFEMAYLDDIPPKVSVNEAIDLGKIYGTEDSGGFINGLLDRLLSDLPKN